MYWANDEIVFMVTRATPWRVLDENAPYSEVDWLMPEEIRFLGSMYLCQEWEGSKLSFYPLSHYAPRIAKDHLDLSRTSVADHLAQTVARAVRYPRDTHKAIELHECATLRYHLMPAKRFSFNSQEKYWDAIRLTNYVLLRGLAALIKSDMLSKHYEFMEEATIQTFIALEASFQLTLRTLKAQGIVNPTAKDAAKWLFENFDKPMGIQVQQMEHYFEDFYHQRVMTFHPSSRFGDMPYAPLMADDYFHLRDALPGIFAYLATGTHSPAFLEEAKRRQDRWK